MPKSVVDDPGGYTGGGIPEATVDPASTSTYVVTSILKLMGCVKMAEDLIFCDYGIEIFKRNGRLYIRYDAGRIVVQMREDEITEEEVAKAQRSEKDAL